MVESPTVRFWEVDLLRGVAILLMVLYHLVFDLNYFAVYDIDVSSGFWLAVARAAASLFLLLVGLSLTLSHSRARMLGQEGRFPRRLLRKSAGIMILALGISAVSYLFVGSCFITFGVLHMIGLSLLLAYPFLRIKETNFIILKVCNYILPKFFRIFSLSLEKLMLLYEASNFCPKIPLEEKI